jgi:hypothetical protein
MIHLSAIDSVTGFEASRPTVLALDIHQHEARRVPQLVAEVAIAFAAVQVEVQRPRERRQGREREAQRVGAERRNPSGNCLRVAFSIDSACFCCIRPYVRFFTSVSRSTPSIRSIGSRHVALRLRHLVALLVSGRWR